MCQCIGKMCAELQANAIYTPKTSGTQITRRKQNVDLMCGVCGLPAKGYHFGGPACESCKVFFRRAVQKGRYRRFICTKGGHCSVSPLVHNRCGACRFAICLQNGMSPKWVMTTDERQKRREYILKKQVLRIDRIYDPDPKDLLDVLTEEEMSTVRTMVRHFKDVSSQVSFQNVSQDICNTANVDSQNAALLALGMMFNIRVIRFAYELPEFSRLKSENRRLLVGSALPLMTVMRCTYEFDNRNKCWPNDRSYDKHFVVPYENYLHKISGASLRRFYAYNDSFHSLAMDEPCLLLLLLITLLSATDNRDGLTETDAVESLQERFLSILSKYVRWKYGTLYHSVVFPKLLGLLTEAQDMRVVSEKHFWLEKFEYEYMEKILGKMNPYHEYSFENRNEEFVPAAVDPFGVLDDMTPTVDMIRRGAATIQKSLVPQEQTSASDNLIDLFSLIEELNDGDSSPDEESSKDNSDYVSSDQSLSPWSPEEFDLSWCSDVSL